MLDILFKNLFAHSLNSTLVGFGVCVITDSTPVLYAKLKCGVDWTCNLRGILPLYLILDHPISNVTAERL